MTTRRREAGTPSHASEGRPAPRVLESEDQQLNDQINGLMRDAAEQLELRTRAEAAEDTAAARRQFDAVVGLARARSGKPRG
jgi:hypothetical protein